MDCGAWLGAGTVLRLMLASALVVMVLGKVWDVPLAMVAQQADVIGFATTAGDGTLRFEQVLKGSAPGTVQLLTGSKTFPCDITSTKPGERALVFLVKEERGFRVMHWGRGTLPVSADGTQVEFFSRRELFVSAALEARCSGRWCPLDGVLEEVRPWLQPAAPTAFIMERFVLNETRASATLRCVPEPESRTLLCGVAGSAPQENLLCHPLEARAELSCRPLKL